MEDVDYALAVKKQENSNEEQRINEIVLDYQKKAYRKIDVDTDQNGNDDD